MTSLSIEGPSSVNAADTANYTATATYDDGSTRTVNAAFSLGSTTAATITAGGAARGTASQSVDNPRGGTADVDTEP